MSDSIPDPNEAYEVIPMPEHWRKVMPSIDRVIKTLAALDVELVAKPIVRSYRSA